MPNYRRVIPRDLFNEANLLKCLGRLYIELERAETSWRHKARYDVEDVASFDIVQDENDGSIFVRNLPFSIDGQRYHLARPLNSRRPYPLWLTHPDNPDFEPVDVFNDDGTLSDDFKTQLSYTAE